MANIKNILAAIVLLAIALSTVYALNQPKASEIETEVVRMVSYEYIGQPGDPNWHHPGNWQEVPELTDCDPGQNICGFVTTEELEDFLEDRNHLNYSQAADLDEIENKP